MLEIDKRKEEELEQVIIENIKRNIRLTKKVNKKLEADKKATVKVISHQIKKEKSYDMER